MNIRHEKFHVRNTVGYELDAQIDDDDDVFIFISTAGDSPTVVGFYLTDGEAYELRDWLNKVLP